MLGVLLGGVGNFGNINNWGGAWPCSSGGQDSYVIHPSGIFWGVVQSTMPYPNLPRRIEKTKQAFSKAQDQKGQHIAWFQGIPRAEMISCITKSSSWILSTPSLSQKKKASWSNPNPRWLKPLSGAKDPIEINGFRKNPPWVLSPKKNRGFPSFIIQLWDLGHVSDGEFLPRGHSGLRHHPRWTWATGSMWLTTRLHPSRSNSRYIQIHL